MRYRADIDGLRAVAVLPVVIFHIAQSYMRGGYVGVDVFFVISGYLISSLIIEEVRSGNFSIARFYERRVRRIAPAFLAATVATTALVLKFGMPTETKEFGAQVISAVLSLSNFYFWQTSNYFNVASESMPLLHTWSLSVEEQFYLLFPPIVMLTWRFSSHLLKTIVVGLFLISLALSVAFLRSAPTATFYLLHTRAWELLLGAMVALQLFPWLAHQRVREWAAALGLGMIAIAALSYSVATPFPGAAALLPCIGAAMVIGAGANGLTIVGRILSFRPLVFIGLISYSLYLWHWPLLVFQKSDAILIATDSKLINRVAVLVASLVVAALSWWFIERPFRGRLQITKCSLFGGAAAIAATLCIVGVATIGMDGFPQRFSPRVRALAAYLDYQTTPMFRTGDCFITKPDDDLNAGTCLAIRSDRPDYLLIGDSHAAQLWTGLQTEFPDINVMQATAAGCKPFVSGRARRSEHCAAVMNYVFETFLLDRHIDGLWLAARWTYEDDANIEETISWAKARGIPVTVFGPIPEYQSALPRLLAKAELVSDPGMPRRLLDRSKKDLNQHMAALVERLGARYVPVFDRMCPGGRCKELSSGGVPLMFDLDHLTQEGSETLADSFQRNGDLFEAPPPMRQAR